MLERLLGSETLGRVVLQQGAEEIHGHGVKVAVGRRLGQRLGELLPLAGLLPARERAVQRHVGRAQCTEDGHELLLLERGALRRVLRLLAAEHGRACEQLAKHASDRPDVCVARQGT